jgi:glucokinase
MDLLADIGGTNVRFAVREGGLPERVRTLRVADFPTVEDAARAYLSEVDAKPRRGAFAVAAPVTGDCVQMTNHRWSWSVDHVRRALELNSLTVLNDFAATALALPSIPRAELRQLGGLDPIEGAPVAVIGPGTGLGISALVGGKPVSTEGGHATMPAADVREAEAIARIRERLGHVSAERVLSGQGLQNLYRALGPDGDPPEPDEITAAALAKTDRRAVDTLDMFCAMLGTVAGNLALTYGARGGVYIAGGIVPKLGDHFAASRFRERFEDKGRFRDYLAPIPVYVIWHEVPALIGLAALLNDPARAE